MRASAAAAVAGSSVDGKANTRAEASGWVLLDAEGLGPSGEDACAADVEAESAWQVTAWHDGESPPGEGLVPPPPAATLALVWQAGESASTVGDCPPPPPPFCSTLPHASRTASRFEIVLPPNPRVPPTRLTCPLTAATHSSSSSAARADCLASSSSRSSEESSSKPSTSSLSAARWSARCSVLLGGARDGSDAPLE